jgi:hypothetical protein
VTRETPHVTEKIDGQANDGVEQACVLSGDRSTNTQQQKTATDHMAQQRLGKMRGGA